MAFMPDSTQERIPVREGVSLLCEIFNCVGTCRDNIILLNGSGFNFKQWNLVIWSGFFNHFEPEMRIIRFDYPGTGGSTCSNPYWSVHDWADDLATMMDRLEIKKAHLYGISQGTAVGQIFALKYPERVKTLSGYSWINSDTRNHQFSLKVIEERLDKFRALSDIWDKALDWDGFKKVWDAIFREAVMKKKLSDMTPLERVKDSIAQKVVYPLMAPMSVHALHDWYQYQVTEMLPHIKKMSKRLKNLNRYPFPRLIQHSMDDRILKVEMARELHKMWKNSVYREYQGNFHHTSISIFPEHAKKAIGDYYQFLKQHQFV